MELEQMAAACHEGGAILKGRLRKRISDRGFENIACKIVETLRRGLRTHLHSVRTFALLAAHVIKTWR